MQASLFSLEKKNYRHKDGGTDIHTKERRNGRTNRPTDINTKTQDRYLVRLCLYNKKEQKEGLTKQFRKDNNN